MTRTSLTEDRMPLPPSGLTHGEVVLQFVRLFPGVPSRGLAPFYHFRIQNPKNLEVGHLNFRVGDNRHVVLFAGHIGYEVRENFRGRRFALQACQAVAPFVRAIYESVIITCDMDNGASRRTIELLGAKFLEEIAVDPKDPAFHRPNINKRRYCWNP